MMGGPRDVCRVGGYVWYTTQNWKGSGIKGFHVYIVLVEVFHASSSAIAASVSAVTMMQCGRIVHKI